jgi:hypothetical protein
MKLRHCLGIGAFLVTALMGSVALAHHGWSSYNAERTMRPTAEILESHWGSPHASIVIAINGARWDVVLAPVSRMETRGLVQADIAVGKTVTVEAYPRSDGTREMRAERITAGGKTVELR